MADLSEGFLMRGLALIEPAKSRDGILHSARASELSLVR